MAVSIPQDYRISAMDVQADKVELRKSSLLMQLYPLPQLMFLASEIDLTDLSDALMCTNFFQLLPLREVTCWFTFASVAAGFLFVFDWCTSCFSCVGVLNVVNALLWKCSILTKRYVLVYSITVVYVPYGNPTNRSFAFGYSQCYCSAKQKAELEIKSLGHGDGGNSPTYGYAFALYV